MVISYYLNPLPLAFGGGCGGLPGRENGVLVLSRADVFSDVRVFLTGDSGNGVIGFAHSQKERCVVASSNLDDISDQSSGTKTKHMNT